MGPAGFMNIANLKVVREQALSFGLRTLPQGLGSLLNLGHKLEVNWIHVKLISIIAIKTCLAWSWLLSNILTNNQST